MKPTDQKGSRLEVEFLIDITGSMGAQIEGVKQMVRAFCKEERDGIGIHLTTFTEDASGCYISHSKPGLTSAELVTYIDKLQLGRPPDFPQVSAGGGDGPENVVAALASLKKRFTPDQNVLAFVITDAPPHHKSNGCSRETAHERAWLQTNGFQDTDIFVVLNDVIESVNVTIVPILYYGMHNNLWYIQAATLTEGVVLCPTNSDSSLLAKGLDSLMRVLQKVAVDRSVDMDSVKAASVACTGFSVLDVDPSTFEPLEEDPDKFTTCQFTLGSGVEKAILGLAMTACDRFAGKRSSKRCTTVDPVVIAASIRVLVYSMLQIVKGETMPELQESVEKLIALLGDSRSQVKLLTSWMDYLSKARLDFSKTVDASCQPVQCSVTLESALEYLSGLEAVPVTTQDVTAWMDIVLQLTMCRLVNVVFPLDINGKTDFNDSWSANVTYVSLATVLSASTAVQIRDQLTCEYIDPLTREKCSSALILSHPNDPVLTHHYMALSSLPSLQGLVQGYLISGGFKVFPALVPGLQSSCLLFFLRSVKPGEFFSPAQWEVIRCILWSLYTSRMTPAGETVQELKEGRYIDPSENIAKVMAAALVCIYKNSELDKVRILKIFFEELTICAVGTVDKLRMRHAEKMKKEGKKVTEVPDFGLFSDAALVRCVITDEENTNYDALRSLHLSEKILFENTPLPESWKKNVLELLSTSTAFSQLSHQIDLVSKLVGADLTEADMEKAFGSVDKSIFLSQEDKLNIFFESVFLQKRTMRYNLNLAENKWHRKKLEEMPNIDDLCRVYITGEYKYKIAGWKSERDAFAKASLLPRVNELTATTYDDCVIQLSELSQEILGKKYMLERGDAMAMLAKIMDKSRLPTLGKAILIGNWTSEPTSCLRKHLTEIKTLFADFQEATADIQAEFNKRELCSRSGPNRHAHTNSNFFPGPFGWTQEYEDKRIAVSPRFKQQTAKCKAYTEFNESASERMRSEEFNDLQRAAARGVIERYGSSLYVEKASEIFEKIAASSEFFSLPENQGKIQEWIKRLTKRKFRCGPEFKKLFSTST